MSNTLWRKARGGTSGARIFAAYVALVLVVSMVGPGLAVYAAEGETEVLDKPEPAIEAPVEPVPAEPAEEAPVVETPVEPSVVSDPVTPEPVVAAVVAAVVAPSALSADPSDLGVVPTTVGGNPALCVGGLRVDPGTSGTYAIPGHPGMFVTVVVTSTDDGPVFSFDSDVPVTRVVAKGGSEGANVYVYDPAVNADGSLHTPVNPSGDYAGISHIDFCFGEIQEPETGDLLIHKFLDANDNGVYDDGEEMLEDWEFTVTLETPPIGDVGASAIMLIGQDVTDADGELLFTGLDPDHYTVRETLQSGWVSTTSLTQFADVVAGETAELWFGNIREELPPETGGLLIHKFLDANENRVYDNGEEMLEDWEFTVTLETPPVEEQPNASAAMFAGSGFTDEDGELLFEGLEPNEYTVRETLKSGWTNTTPLTQIAVVSDGETAELWFGNVEEFLPFTELDLAITKVADDHSVVEGQIVKYTLTYWNNGDLAAENYTIVDDYDERYLSIVDASGGVVSGGKITWTLAGPLAKADGMKTITYTAKVITDMPDKTTNIDNIVVISHPRDTDPTNNTDNERVVYTWSEAFLPFTGGDYTLLIGFAVAAMALGLLLRLRTDSAA
ncbi:MAG: SpaA isopeptide-forming pilin-related protein [Coriobacteriia bacterium]